MVTGMIRRLGCQWMPFLAAMRKSAQHHGSSPQVGRLGRSCSRKFDMSRVLPFSLTACARFNFHFRALRSGVFGSELLGVS
jgi:hypothetical protein